MEPKMISSDKESRTHTEEYPSCLESTRYLRYDRIRVTSSRIVFEGPEILSDRSRSLLVYICGFGCLRFLMI